MSTDQDLLTELSAAIDGLLEAAWCGTNNLVAELAKVDEMFVSISKNESLQTAVHEKVGQVLATIRQDPDVFARLNSAASLVIGLQSSFFRALILTLERVGDELNDQELLFVIESNRRVGEYTEMEKLVALLSRRLAANAVNSSLMGGSRQLYELSMAAQQRGEAFEKDDDAAAARQWYERSFEYAERSSQLAVRANDPIGRLLAEVNVIAGLLLPALGMWEVAITMLDRAYEEVAALAQVEVDPVNLRRLQRARMNGDTHRIRISVKYEDNPDTKKLQGWFDELDRNPVYVEARGGRVDPVWAAPEIMAARELTAKKR